MTTAFRLFIPTSTGIGSDRGGLAPTNTTSAGLWSSGGPVLRTSSCGVSFVFLCQLPRRVQTVGLRVSTRRSCPRVQLTRETKNRATQASCWRVRRGRGGEGEGRRRGCPGERRRGVWRRWWPTNGKRIWEFRTFWCSPVSFWIERICSSSRRQERSGRRRVCPREGSGLSQEEQLRGKQTTKQCGE